MTELTPEEKSQELRQHVALMGKIAVWSGWVLAAAAMLISGYILNKMHLEIVDMQSQNKELRLQVEKSQMTNRFEQQEKAEAEIAAEANSK